ncbi:6-bladed beta-propeller [Rhodohalobacter sp. SW132]|uniref:6-bladed beta-propeller n=1 Tax=Rhodohalobacter sp. SW132 TaxID=2293433 RepID=UPI00131458C9|nr:6-bladed beta-propeller [Rhodohalobacter sp. SW132]
MIYRYAFILLLMLISACTQTADEPSFTIENHTVDTADLLLSPETVSELGMPSGLLSDEDRLLVYDSQAVSMMVFDSSGEKEFQFGREGDGPGEFRFIPEFWLFDDTYVLYDRSAARILHFTRDGDFIEDFAVETGSLAISIATRSATEFYLPAGGEGSALIQFSHLTDDEENRRFGEKFAQSDGDIDIQQAQSDAISGRVPSFMQNQILLSSNESGLYSFQQSTGLLQKYSHEGELEWDQTLELPASDGIFDQYVENNQMMSERGQGNVIMLQYATQIEADEDGVAILLSTLEPNPVTIAWLPNDGSSMQEIQFPGLDEYEARPRSFTISDDGSTIYFTAAMDGSVYSANWPL